MNNNLQSNAMSVFQTSQTMPTRSDPGFGVNLLGFAGDTSG